MPSDEQILDVTIGTDGLRSLTAAIRAEADGKELRKDLAKSLREALKPAAAEAKAGIMGMASAGPSVSPALRSTIARGIRPEIKLGGKWSGARVRVPKTQKIRGFRNAPKKTQSPRGWRHPVFGNKDNWVEQRGKINWFDGPLNAHRDVYRRAVADAVEAMAQRIASRTR